jgi:hypothetical protein
MSPRAGSALLMAAALAATGSARAGERERAGFEELKQLVGTWQPAEKPDALRVTFALTAGGTVLTESWASPRHTSMTVYHLDGDALLATHYCPRGNQPRLALTGRAADGTLRFVFRDGTGLDEAGEYYEHVLTLRRDDAGRLIRGEVYAEHGKPLGELPAPEETRFVRVATPYPAGP